MTPLPSVISGPHSTWKRKNTISFTFLNLNILHRDNIWFVMIAIEEHNPDPRPSRKDLSFDSAGLYLMPLFDGWWRFPEPRSSSGFLYVA